MSFVVNLLIKCKLSLAGTINLFDCIEAPIVVSLPHFYMADPSMLTQIQSGLVPNETEHAFYIDYEMV